MPFNSFPQKKISAFPLSNILTPTMVYENLFEVQKSGAKNNFPLHISTPPISAVTTGTAGAPGLCGLYVPVFSQ